MLGHRGGALVVYPGMTTIRELSAGRGKVPVEAVISLLTGPSQECTADLELSAALTANGQVTSDVPVTCDDASCER